MKKVFYFFLAFLVIYIGIFSGSLLVAFFIYQDTGNFILTEEDYLSPIRPAIIALVVQVFVAKLLPSKKRK